ncbi:TadE/TadG family type IV pilus assembly protein [Pontixanthobacter sp. CEM42]|uniref:TadE/TadG family type IV pilus assembly protein n=1 Tax=Pontixanthobacter sp. CEM42 TaxID=2792077 RepID=UPI001AE0E5F4|nr:TadE/TadG family type IV pilus assembly protein [Pontixanthobacter sp. CEM42]
MFDQNAIKSDAAYFLHRLAKDRSGNTLALIAAAIVPLLGMVGSGIDMGRAYLASSRLQAACDAGVLAARKKLGTEAAVTGAISPQVAEIGQRFFNLNFRSGAYGSENREFTMTLEDDYAISGDAEVSVPTSIMMIFGFSEIPIAVDCQALLSVRNLDVMMVLDVTGSMRHSNTDDSASRIDSLKSVIRSFHAQLENAKAPDNEIRYGFVPYATNVNVGHLLEDSWVTSDWTYQSRVVDSTETTTQPRTVTRNWQTVSGESSSTTEESRYAATFTPGTGDSSNGSWTCSQALPTGNYDSNTELVSTETTTDANGNEVITREYKLVQNGKQYWQAVQGEECVVWSREYTDFTRTYDRITSQDETTNSIYEYRPVALDVSNWRTDFDGCIEERATTEITDFANVDITQNLDLDLDTLPTPGDPTTQWRPSNPSAIYARSFYSNGSGSFTTEAVKTSNTFATTGTWWFSDCPAKAQKLQEMDSDAIDDYLATLAPYGATYHDIGMIWGGRLISPTGLFASENADTDGQERGRHLIFLTDGQTEPYDLAYGAYGVEGLDQRRWNRSSTLSLAETVEGRFSVACAEVKKRNVTVWVIAFGTFLNQAMLDCAGNGQYFEASNAEELNNAFSAIAKSIGDLRISE